MMSCPGNPSCQEIPLALTLTPLFALPLTLILTLTVKRKAFSHQGRIFSFVKFVIKTDLCDIFFSALNFRLLGVNRLIRTQVIANQENSVQKCLCTDIRPFCEWAFSHTHTQIHMSTACVSGSYYTSTSSEHHMKQKERKREKKRERGRERGGESGVGF